MTANNYVASSFFVCAIFAVSYSSTGVNVPVGSPEQISFTSSGTRVANVKNSQILELGSQNLGLKLEKKLDGQSAYGSAKLISDLHLKSGLTWDQLASIFDVSRRSMHNWASGEKMNSANLTKLTEIVEIVDKLEANNPQEVRIKLLSTASGKSLLAKFREGNFEGERALHGANHISKRLGVIS